MLVSCGNFVFLPALSIDFLSTCKSLSINGVRVLKAPAGHVSGTDLSTNFHIFHFPLCFSVLTSSCSSSLWGVFILVCVPLPDPGSYLAPCVALTFFEVFNMCLQPCFFSSLDFIRRFVCNKVSINSFQHFIPMEEINYYKCMSPKVAKTKFWYIRCPGHSNPAAPILSNIILLLCMYLDVLTHFPFYH